jgi:hypothetical protein
MNRDNNSSLSECQLLQGNNQIVGSKGLGLHH